MGSDRTNGARRNPVAGVLFIALALLALVSVAGFHPEHSLLLSPEGGGRSAHLLGPLFQKIASWLFYFLGRGAYFLIFALFYQGVLRIRNMKPAARAGLGICTLGALASFLALMGSASPVAHRGGGLFGRFLAANLASLLGKGKAAPLAGTVFGGALLLMFASPIRRAVDAARRAAARRTAGRAPGRE
ncbi:MAG: DNA translocase FtsK 4TM domain-containing protein, partial [Spirochaetota bacterium]